MGVSYIGFATCADFSDSDAAETSPKDARDSNGGGIYAVTRRNFDVLRGVASLLTQGRRLDQTPGAW